MNIGEVPHNVTGADVTMHVAGGDWPELNQMMAVTGLQVGEMTASSGGPSVKEPSFEQMLKPENPAMG